MLAYTASFTDCFIRANVSVGEDKPITATYSGILGWSEFLFARTFITQPEKWTITVGLSSLKGEYVIIWGEIMAAAVISVIPIALIFIFLEKYMVAGVTSGAVKG